MRKNATMLLVGLAAALIVSAAPLAQTESGRNETMPITGVTNASEVIRESRFAFLDFNGDGYLSRDEVPEDDAVLNSMFSSLDENDDGRLSEAEYVLNGEV